MNNPTAEKILVIDDESTHRILAKEYLEGAGYVVRLAEDGSRGLALAKKLKPELVLVDLLIPGVDGLKICRALKSTEDTSDIPIILITASREPDVIARGLEAGADDFITKPVDWEFIGDRVAYVLAKSSEKRRMMLEAREMMSQLHGDGADAAPGHAAPGEEGNANLQAVAALEAELAETRQAVDSQQAVIEQQASDIEGLRRMLQSKQDEFAAIHQEARRAQAAELEDLVNRHAQEVSELCSRHDSITDRLKSELESAVKEKSSVQALRAQQLEAKLRASNADQKNELDSARREHAAAIAKLRGQLAAERDAALNEQARLTEAVRVAEGKLQEALERPTSVADVEQTAASRDGISASWDFVRACSTVFQNQLRAMTDPLSIIKDAAVTDRGLTAATAQLEQATAALGGLLSNMRLLAQMMARKEALRETSFDLGELVADAVERTRPLAEHNKVHVDLSPGLKALVVTADEARMQFAVLSLLVNAIRYSPHGSRVAVSVCPDGEGNGAVIVRDQGVGINPTLLKQMHQCLDTASWPVSDSKLGLGIPLAMAIARAHDGRLELESVIGDGTTAMLKLPAPRIATSPMMQKWA